MVNGKNKKKDRLTKKTVALFSKLFCVSINY